MCKIISQHDSVTSILCSQPQGQHKFFKVVYNIRGDLGILFLFWNMSTIIIVTVAASKLKIWIKFLGVIAD